MFHVEHPVGRRKVSQPCVGRGSMAVSRRVGRRLCRPLRLGRAVDQRTYAGEEQVGVEPTATVILLSKCGGRVLVPAKEARHRKGPG